MVASFPRFSDVQNHWAKPFIEVLVQRGIIRGFPDQTFRPDRNISRAEFAALVQAALPQPISRASITFTDVPATHWAATAIRKAYEMGLLSGYPNQQFRPDDPIIRCHALLSLVSGLGVQSFGQVSLAELYQDSNQIPTYAVGAIALATEAEIVVNYPDLKRLNPQQAATRAEVTAFIYQCLVYLGQATPIASNYIVRWVKTVAVGHAREFRGVWLTTVWNRDWPSKAGLPVAQQQAELVALLDRVQAMNFNAVILQVRPEGDALYSSQLDPWSHWLTGTQGKAPVPLYDPLEFAIAQCRQRNLELHAWFNPFRARTSTGTVNAAPHMAVTNPEVVYPWGNQLWMDPGAKIVQDRAYNVILDVVRRYDVDGIHLDDYFYPYPIANQKFPDDKTYQAYRTSGGTLVLADWRRENVNQLIQRLAIGIRAAKPQVKFGISPFGIYRPGQPPSVRGLDAYEQLYADSLKWLQQGWVDYLSPQLYWRTDAPAQSYPVLLQWWAENNAKQRHLYPGNTLEHLDGTKVDVPEIERQVELTRQLKAQSALGNVFFCWRALSDNWLGITDRFQTATYARPSLSPVMPWLQDAPPGLPQNVQIKQGQLTWNKSTAVVRSWTLYRQEGDRWLLQQVLPASVNAIAITPGTYALCSVNRLAAESPGVVISLK